MCTKRYILLFTWKCSEFTKKLLIEPVFAGTVSKAAYDLSYNFISEKGAAMFFFRETKKIKLKEMYLREGQKDDINVALHPNLF